MVDMNNDMDQIFRERFTGLRDHSVNPDSAWKAVDSSLNASSFASAGTAVLGKAFVLKVAASIASILFITAMSVGDRELNKTGQNGISYESTTSTFDVKEQFEKPFKNESLAVTPSQNNQIFSPLDDKDSGQNGAEQSFAIHENQPILKPSPTTTIDQGATPFHPLIELMPTLGFDRPQSSLALRDFEAEGPIIEAWKSNHIVYFKGGMRVGSGESNSFEIDSKWRANMSFSFGYGFSLSDRSYITAEAGWLRRSGNGIERTRLLSLNPLVDLITETTTGVNTLTDEIVINESLIATQMDYIHMPIAFHKLFNQTMGFEIGGFADYLINAKNEAFIVYDNTQYQSSVIGKSELSSLKGLNKFRYGIIAGVEKTFTDHLILSCEMMVPLNSAVDDKSDYRVIDNSNKLIDFQFSLAYRL